MVASGIAGRCAVLADGRRQIVDLLVPGDFFGFYAGDAHRFSVEAVTNKTSILRYPRQSVEAIVEANPKLQYCVRQMAFEAILRLDARVLTVGRMTAVEKVGSFLLEMAERFPQSGMRIALPISRYDIADYLGLSMETVSRSLAELKRRGSITFSGPHRVTVLNPNELRGE
jgi:CRP-like cAMP-binding protein